MCSVPPSSNGAQQRLRRYSPVPGPRMRLMRQWIRAARTLADGPWNPASSGTRPLQLHRPSAQREERRASCVLFSLCIYLIDFPSYYHTYPCHDVADGCDEWGSMTSSSSTVIRTLLETDLSTCNPASRDHLRIKLQGLSSLIAFDGSLNRA